MSKLALHSVSNVDLRLDRDRIGSLKVGSFKEMAQNRKELAIITTEISRRPMIKEDVFK